MKAKLHPYQRRAADFIQRVPRCALWMEMGLGKTLTTLTALRELILLREVEGPTLVVAPLRVATHTWPAELAKWDHLRDLSYDIIAGKSPAQRRQLLLSTHKDLYFVNYEMLLWLTQHFAKKWPFKTLVLDESSKVKSVSADRYKAVKSVRGYCDRIIELTGTPAPNGLLDVWAPIFLLDNGERLETSQGAFKARYFYFNQEGVVRAYDRSEERITRKLRDIVVSMKAKDYLDVPPFTLNRVEVELPRKAQDLYRDLEERMVADLKHAIEEAAAKNTRLTITSMAALSAKCHQLSCGSLYLQDEEGNATKDWASVHDAKYDALDDIIDEANGQPILLVYWFGFDRERIAKRYPHVRFMDKKGTVVDEWNRGEVPLLAVNPASAGHGLNMQDGGHILVHMTPQWALELDEQVNARLHRQGQKRPVIAHYIIAKGTIEDDIMYRLKTKASLQEVLKDRLKLI